MNVTQANHHEGTETKTGGGGSYRCPGCGIEFPEREAFREHLRRHADCRENAGMAEEVARRGVRICAICGLGILGRAYLTPQGFVHGSRLQPDEPTAEHPAADACLSCLHYGARGCVGATEGSDPCPSYEPRPERHHVVAGVTGLLCLSGLLALCGLRAAGCGGRTAPPSETVAATPPARVVP